MKDNFITVRVSDENLAILNHFCDTFNMSRSDLIRSAVAQYFFINLNKKTNPKMIISQMIQKKILGYLNLEQVKEVAEISFKVGQKDNLVDKLLNPNEQEMNNFQNMKFSLDSLVKNIFPQEGQNWFKKTHLENKSDYSFVFTGSHNLGKNFSLFIRELLNKYSIMNNYSLSKDNIKENIISVELIPKNN